MNTLARFRADPSRVRVGIRYIGKRKEWLVSIQERVSGYTSLGYGRTPMRALAIVLKHARAGGYRGPIEGFDPDMQWAYEHPFGKPMAYCCRCRSNPVRRHTSGYCQPCADDRGFE